MTMNEQKKTYDRESYVFWKAQRRCVRCHMQDAYTLAGRSRCAECAALNRREKARYREKNREKLRGKNAAWYDAKKSAACCVRCGKPLADDGHTVCAMCRGKVRAYDTERRIQAGRYGKNDPAVCGVCNRRPPMAGKLVCPACYAQNLRNLEKANAAKDNIRHPWRRMAHAEAAEKRAAG